MDKQQAFRDKLAELCERYVTPGDIKALAMVEGMINESFIRAGAPPPSRIKLSFGDDNTVLVGFEGG